MSIDTLTTAIRHALEQARHLIAGVGASKDQATEVHDRIAALGAETSAANAGATADHLEEGQALAAAIADRLESALAAAEAARAGTGGTSGGGGGAPPSGPPPPTASGPSPERPIPTFVRRLAEQLPVRESGDKTHLLAYTNEDGEPVAYASGRRRDARDGLKPEFARRFVVKDHAEGHVAADMRRPGAPEHVTVVINNTPCPSPVGCDATIPHIIPKDATMTVYVTDGATTTHYATYTGTGEGIHEQQD